MAQQYTNIRLILDKLMRHPLMRDLTLETAVDYTIDFMRIIGAPKMFIEKTEVLEINKYRAPLPCDYYQMIQVRDGSGKVFRYSTDSFHMSDCKRNNSINLGLTYKIQGGIIYTSIEKGKIEISYEAIATDSEGYPLLPDNSNFTRALEQYIKLQWFTILFDLGKISQAVLNNTQQEYAWAVGSCSTDMVRLSIDEMESFTNSWNTLIVRASSHRDGFASDSVKEKIRVV